MQFRKIPDVRSRVPFAANSNGHRWGLIRRDGLFLGPGCCCDCRTGQEALWMQPRKERKKERKGHNSLRELRSAAERTCRVWSRDRPRYRLYAGIFFWCSCVTELASPAHLCDKNICSLALLHEPLLENKPRSHLGGFGDGPF